jgi:putative DNA primase/helicase
MTENEVAASAEEQQNLEVVENKEPQTEDSETEPGELAYTAMEQCRFFHTMDHVAFAIIERDGHQETWPIKSRDFDLWLRFQAYKAEGKIPSAQTIRDTIRVLEGEALINSPVQTIHIRLAQHEGDIYLDLANPPWEQIRITKDEYKVVPAKDSPVRFMRTEAMLALPYPEPGEPLGALRHFLNIEHEGDLVLIVSWLIGAMREEGPFPILMLQGEQGTAKSFTSKLLRSLIDPFALESRGLPKSERDLAITATKAWVLSFDNLSHLEGWLSDALCRVATGGGLATRTLYTDNSETIFRFKRPLIMNGISDIATRHDLADRSLIINLPVIPEEKRKSERQIWESWLKVRPQILGALCGAVSAGIQNIGQVKLERFPRMADFAEWVVAAEPNLPWEEGRFLKEYALNREYLVEVGLESDEVGSAMLQLMQRRNTWSGTPTELLRQLNRIVSKNIQRRNYWPKRPNTLSSRLVRVAPVLRKKGIEIDRSKSGVRNITITRIVKRTVLIDRTVQQPETIGKSPGRVKDAGAFPVPYVPSARMAPEPRIMGDQGDADDQNESSTESKDAAEERALKAAWERGEL